MAQQEAAEESEDSSSAEEEEAPPPKRAKKEVKPKAKKEVHSIYRITCLLDTLYQF